MSNNAPNRVVVVSNRLPVTLKRVRQGWRTDHSVGGLSTAMMPILKRTGGIWIGWDGNASGMWDEKRRDILGQWRESDGYISVDLPPEVAHGFYDGFANQVLWPLLHHFTSMLKFDSAH